MEMTTTLPLLIVAVLLIGALVGWLVARSQVASLVASAAGQARAEGQIELATRNERVRGLEDESREAKVQLAEQQRQAEQWRSELDLATNENARLEERASRVPLLEAELKAVHHKLEDLEDELGAVDEEAAKLTERASHVPKLESERDDARRQVDDLGRQLADLRAITSNENGRLRAEVEAGAKAVTRLTQERDEGRMQLQAAEAQFAHTKGQLIEVETRTDQERENLREQLRLLQDARTALADQFKNLANDILEEKSKRFAEQNQVNLSTLLDPLRTKLADFQGKVEEVYVQESKDRSALQEQVKHLMSLNQTLSEDAKNLTLALKGSAKTQGNWGELILERVLELSGLRKGVEYMVQEGRAREEGGVAIPDVVIHLPEERRLVVDSKVSLVAYERYVSAATDADRASALKGHLDSVRAHIKGLSAKRYQDLYGLRSLDFVLAFVPIEPAFMMAVTNDGNLFNEAWNQNVLLVSPSTLLFVVRTVAHLWRQEAQNRNAQDIARRGAELYDKLTGFVTDLQVVGNRIKQAREAYELAENKLVSGRGNVIRQAELLRQLGVKPSKSLPPALIDAAVDHDEPRPDAEAALLGFPTETSHPAPQLAGTRT